MLVKNITVAVDEATHRIARIRAAEMGTSVSALVRNYLKSLVLEHVSGTLQNETVIELRRRRLEEVIETITADGGGLRMADNLPREQLYDRARARSEARATTERDGIEPR